MKKSKISLIIILGFTGLCLLLYAIYKFDTSKSLTTENSSKICIIGHPLNDSAQMFLELKSDSGSVMINNGVKCEYLGSTTYKEAGIEIPYYKLNCPGSTGYINEKWVQCP